jgi:heat shock protein HslJ
MVALTPIVTDNTPAPTDTDHMYLGMKTWEWVKSKDPSGKVTMASSDKPFTLTFDFNSSKYSVTTDCNTGGGLFAAKSGVVQLGEDTLTKNSCDGSQEGLFTGLIASAQKFFFVTEKGEMVLTAKDGSEVVFK